MPKRFLNCSQWRDFPNEDGWDRFPQHNYRTAPPVESEVKEQAARFSKPFFWDAEGAWWNDNVEAGWTQMAKWTNEVVGDAEYGFYGAFPLREYWRTPEEIDAKNARNAGFASHVPLLLPTSYNFYTTSGLQRGTWFYMVENQHKGWQKYAPEVPCYPMIWELFHPGSATELQWDSIIKHTSVQYWESMVRFVLDRFPGLSYWGGWRVFNNPGPASFTDPMYAGHNAQWYPVMTDLMAEYGNTQGPPVEPPEPEPPVEPEPPTPEPDPTLEARLTAVETGISQINTTLEAIQLELQKGRKARKDAGTALSS